LTEAINFTENQQTAVEAVGEWLYALIEMLAEDNDDLSQIGNIFAVSTFPNVCGYK